MLTATTIDVPDHVTIEDLREFTSRDHDVSVSLVQRGMRRPTFRSPLMLHVLKLVLYLGYPFYPVGCLYYSEVWET